MFTRPQGVQRWATAGRDTEGPVMPPPIGTAGQHQKKKGLKKENLLTGWTKIKNTGS